MKPLSIAIALLGLLTVSFAADTRAQINASLKTISAAMKKKDAAYLEKVMKAQTTADFEYTEAGKVQKFPQFIANMKMGVTMMDTMSVCEAKLLTLKQKGNKAFTTMRHVMVGTMKGEDKKSHTMAFDGVSENTYVKQGGVWKMATMTWKKMKQTMDGKPMPAMGG
jgi:hypothetical protein